MVGTCVGKVDALSSDKIQSGKGIGKSFRDIVIVVTVKNSKVVRPTAFKGTSDNHGCFVSI